MARITTLRGVAHDVVDHASSAFGWLHPHVAEFATKKSVLTVTINLLNAPAIHTKGVPRPLRLASEALQEWFAGLLTKYGFEAADLAAAEITFGAFSSDGSTCGSTARITSSGGRTFVFRRGWPPGITESAPNQDDPSSTPPNSRMQRTSARRDV